MQSVMLTSFLPRHVGLGMSDELRDPMVQIPPELKTRLDRILEEIPSDR